MSKIGRVLSKISSGKLLVGGVLAAIVMAFGTTGVVAAAPSYFNVDKPSSTAQCNGSTTTYTYEWSWGSGNNTNNPNIPAWLSWLLSLFGHWTRVEHQTPNWERLGFSSKSQCVRYVSTPAPSKRSDCTNGGWFTLGFNNQGQCIRYLRLNGGGGYGGDV